MKPFWTAINLILVLALCGAGFFLVQNYRIFLGALDRDSERVSHAASKDEESFDYPDAVRFRLKVDALCQEEAILLEPGEPLKFTLRPTIDLPTEASSRVVGWVSSKPGLEEKIAIDWKSEGGGELRSAGPGRYEFTPPPEGGDVVLKFRGEYRTPEGAGVAGRFGGETSLHFICPIPWDGLDEETRTLVGRYPIPKEDGTLDKELYRRPSHFYEVNRDNEDLRISPHFRLGDFDLHFDYNDPESATAMNRFPQYIALNPRLVMKLEAILAGLQEKGVEVDTLGILAGFRSPAYNGWKKRVGGVGGKYTSKFSMHMYGNAADFFVDRDGDGAMDDMNGDGVIDQGDAAWIREQVVDRVDCQAELNATGLAGACGVYGQHDIPDRAIQTPNLHVDTRGNNLRWYINPRDTMVTDYDYWTRQPCDEVLNAS